MQQELKRTPRTPNPRRCVFLLLLRFSLPSALRMPGGSHGEGARSTSQTNQRLLVGPAVTTLRVHWVFLVLLRPVSILQLEVFKNDLASLCSRVSPRKQPEGQTSSFFMSGWQWQPPVNSRAWRGGGGYFRPTTLVVHCCSSDCR